MCIWYVVSHSFESYTHPTIMPVRLEICNDLCGNLLDFGSILVFRVGQWCWLGLLLGLLLVCACRRVSEVPDRDQALGLVLFLVSLLLVSEFSDIREQIVQCALTV